MLKIKFSSIKLQSKVATVLKMVVFGAIWDSPTRNKRIRMDEILNNEVAEVVTQENVVNEPVEQQPEVQPALERRQDRNWKELNRAKEDLERKARMQEEMIERLLKANPQPQVVEKDEFDEISDEEFIPKGKVKGLVKKEAERIAEAIAKREYEKLMKQQEQSQFMEKLQRQYSDFNEVVNPETLSLFEEQEPELAQAIAESKDPYKIGVQSYKYIKAMNLTSKVPETRRAKEVDRKIKENEKIVQSPMTYDKRPMAQAFKLTKEEQSKLYEEMTQYAGMAGYGY